MYNIHIQDTEIIRKKNVHVFQQLHGMKKRLLQFWNYVVIFIIENQNS